MKPTLNDIIEKYKDVKEVFSLGSNQKLEIIKDSFHLALNAYFADSTIDGKSILLYNLDIPEDGYAEIISYKEKPHTITDTFLKELCKEQNIKEAFIREGIVIEETYIKIPLSEIKASRTNKYLADLVRNIAENY